MGRKLSCALLAGCLAFPVDAAAQEEEARRQAQGLFERARAAQASQDWRLCVGYLRRALEVKQTPGLWFHSAYCKEQQSLWMEALSDYERAQQLLRSGVSAPDVAELLPPAVDRLKAEMPQLELVIHDPGVALTAFLDGTRHPELLKGSVRANPGAHALAVHAPGFEPFVQDITLLPSDKRVVEVVLIPAPTVPPAAPPKASSPPSDAESRVERPGALASANDSMPLVVTLLLEGAVVATGAGLVIWGSLEQGSASSVRDELQVELGSSGCSEANPDLKDLCRDFHQETDRIERAMTWTHAGYALAGVGTAAALATWLLWPIEDADTAATSLSPSLSADGLELTVRGRF